MGYRRLTRTAHYLVTVFLLVTVIITTFLPDWVQRSQAAAPAVEPAPAAASSAETGPAAGGPASITTPELAPLNALILSEPGRAEALKSTLMDLGGYVYVSQGDALFAGVNDLTLSDLAPLGARAVFRETVAGDDLAALSPDDRDVVAVWNEMIGAEPVGEPGDSAPASIRDIDLDSRETVLAADSTLDPQTSSFLVGSVTVEVVFVESTGAGENWTADEISKVKSEVVSALDWWTVVARAPDEEGNPRPPAHLDWRVNYYSPLEGTTEQRNAVKVGVEPIQDPITSNSWMGTISLKLKNTANLSVWARQARDESSAAAPDGTDWAFVLFVVDSSNDDDGRFSDAKSAAAALSGPWAVVSSRGGDLGTANLEILIAKMIGHVFGAGDEAYCSSEEYYGYLRVPHDHCEMGGAPTPSLMRAGNDMISAYKDHRLSDTARGQVGWLDMNENGVYDVIDTLMDTFEAPPSPEVCPVLHLNDVEVHNNAAVPSDPGPGSDTAWWNYIWDFNTSTFKETIEYRPTNINHVGFVWGKVNNGDWIAGTLVEDNPANRESYNLLLPGNAGSVNPVEIAIMNRWGQEAYSSPSPENVTVQASSLARPEPYESESSANVALYPFNGNPLYDWSPAPDAGYSGGTTMVAGYGGSEACFSVYGTEARILYNNEAGSAASPSHMDVYVDGELHSTIKYTGVPQQMQHTISNLPDGDHTIQLFAGDPAVDFDAFIVSDMRADTLSVIDALDVEDIAAEDEGFYEDTGAKIKYVGQWATEGTYALNDTRPGTPDDSVHTSLNANDRLYIRFKQADTLSIYREVFPGGGSADVFIDDGFESKYWGTMYNDATVPMVVPYTISGLVSSPGLTYTIEIRINPGTPRFTFDALRLQNVDGTPELYAVAGDDPLEIPFDGAQEMFGGWQVRSGYMRGAGTGDLMTLYFKGMAVAVNRDTASGRGVMELYVDGKLRRTVDNRDAGAKDAPVVLHGFDPNRPHALQIRVVRENPNRAKWNHIRGFSVFNVPVVGPGSYEEYEYDANGVPTHSRFLYEQAWASPVNYTRTPGPSGEHYIFSKHKDAKVYLYFNDADTVTIYGASAAKFGAADVYVNGELRGTFVQKGNTGFNQPFTITGLDKLATNVLELRVADERGMKKSISLDRVAVYNRPVLAAGIYENDHTVGEFPALQFSGQWNRVEDVEASGTYDVVGSGYDQVVFDVRDASSVVIYRRLFKKYGRAEVYVDGVYHSSFDNATNTARYGVYQQPHVIGGLDRGFSHRIVIKPEILNKKGKYKPFDIDYIEVRNIDAEGVTYLEDNYYDQDDPGALAGGAISYQGSNWTIDNPTPDNPYTRDESVSEAHGAGRGDRAVVTFRGNAFSVFFNRFGKAGVVDIYIDGELAGSVKNKSLKPVYDVPFSVGGLANKTHVAEIIIRSGQVGIDAYMARTMIPDLIVNTPDLKNELNRDPMQSPVLFSGLWTVDGDYITTREKEATIYAYGGEDDTLIMTREAKKIRGNIDIYIDNELHTTAETNYLGGWPTPDEEYEVSGLARMRDDGAWIAVRNTQSKPIMLKKLLITGLGVPLGSTSVPPGSCDVEAEDQASVERVHAAGSWKQMPGRANDQHSGGYYLQSGSKNSSIYIPIQNVNYLTVYRPVARSLGDAEVYVDGVYWGIMPGEGTRAQAQVPFSIGPIDQPTQAHVVELRPAHKRKKIAIDRVTCEGLLTLSPDLDDYFGYYENDSEALTGLDANGDPVSMPAYSGNWKEVDSVNASGGSNHRTTRRGDRLAALFIGNSITIYRETSRMGRLATAYIDGIAYPINNKSNRVQHRVPHTILLPGAPEDTHTLELVVNGGRFDLDAIQIDYAAPAVFGYHTAGDQQQVFGSYQEDHPLVIVNDANHWETVESAAHSDGAYIETKTKYASVFFLFNGQRVTTYMTQGRNWGRVSVYLDGQFREEVDLYKFDKSNRNAPDEPFFTYDITNLPRANHVLELRFEGSRTKGGKPRMNFDVFSVNGAPVPRPGEEISPPTPPDIGGGDPGGDITAPRLGCFEDTHGEWVRVGAWNNPSVAGASGGYLVESNGSPGEEVYAEFDFAAEGFGLLVAKGPSGGYADIYVNGDLFRPDYSMYNETLIALDPAQTLITGTGYDPNVVNVVRVLWKETAGPGGGTRIYIDRIDLPAYDSKYNPPPEGDGCFYIPED